MNFSQASITPILWAVALLIIIVIINKLKQIFQMIYVWAVLIILIIFITGYYVGAKPQDTLQSVRNREQLKCGINGDLPGFSQGETNSKGFDADFCRVIAAAIFEDVENLGELNDKIKFVRPTTLKRFPAIENGEVDVLIRNTTWNVGRDIERNIDFGPMIFLDSQGFLAHRELDIETLQDLDGKSVCALPNTTTIDNLNNLISDTLSDTISFGELITTTTGGENFRINRDIFYDYTTPLRKCDVVTSDKSQLYAISKSLELDLNNGDYIILPRPGKFITTEPLSPAFIGGDKVWNDIVTYSIYATIYASELGISSTNVVDYNETKNLKIRRFLGLEEENSIGERLGLSNDFAQRIIRLVGNYDEIYVRNLNDIIPERGVNRTWKDNGILISPPF